MTTIEGIAASPGACVAPAVLLVNDQLDLPSGPVEQRDPEVTSLEKSLEATAQQLEQRASESSGELAEVLEAQAMMARDPELFEAARKAIQDDGTPAAKAIVEAAETFAEALASSDSEYMAARATDVRDVAKLIARSLLGVPEVDLAQLQQPSVVVAHDVSPADVARLDFEVVKGFATEEGSRTSHTAIVARSFGVPAVVAAAGLVDAVKEGDVVGVDGDAGLIYVDPDEVQTGELESRSERRAQAQQELASTDVVHTRTSDGHDVELGANVGSLKELENARQMGARAVGLLRTELVFFDRKEAPTEKEHAELLTAMASLLDGGRLVIRTFDFGADKPMPFLEVASTSDSALGVRGIRLARAQPELLEAQLRAIATVADSGCQRRGDGSHGGDDRRGRLVCRPRATVWGRRCGGRTWRDGRGAFGGFSRGRADHTTRLPFARHERSSSIPSCCRSARGFVGAVAGPLRSCPAASRQRSL